MQFDWPQAYTNFQSQVTDFARERLCGRAREHDAAQHFPREAWRACAEFGIQGMALPAAYGGPLEEVDFARSLLAMEALGRGCEDNGLAFALNAQMWTVQTPILHFGSEEQKQRYLPKMASGDCIGAHAITEPEAGSDAASMRLAAERVDGGYILNGEKHLITLAPIADVVLVFAQTDAAKKAWGITAFLIDGDAVGMVRSEKHDKMGMRSVPIGSLNFTDCFVPESSVLGRAGLGYSIMNHSLEYDRACILASQLGAMERQLKDAVRFAKKRKQYGRSIGKFQAVSHRLVDMKVRLETARLLLYKVTALITRGKPAQLEATMLKLYLSESFLTSSLDALRTYGGAGYLGAGGVERDLRDAVGGILYAGTSDIQRNIIAQYLGL